MHQTKLLLSLVLGSLSSLLLFACNDDEPAEVEETGDVVVDVTGMDLSGFDNGGDGISFPDVTPTDTTEESTGDLAYGDEVIEWIEDELCADLCERLEECDRGNESCMDDCAESVRSEPGFIGRAACVDEAACDDIGHCLEGEIPDDRRCEEFCELVGECDAYEMFEMPSDPAICDEVCDGVLGSGSEQIQGVVPCLIDHMADSCDMMGLQRECFGEGGPNCDEICGNVGDCPSGSPVRATFPSSGACREYCEELGGEQSLALALCLDIGECDGSNCDEIPERTSGECRATCEASIGLCGAGDDPMWREYCDWICEALVAALPWANPVGAADCVADLDECPPNPGEPGEDDGPPYAGAMLTCMARNPDCDAICDHLVPCINDPEFHREACNMACVMDWSRGPGGLAELRECVEGEEQCDELIACLP